MTLADVAVRMEAGICVGTVRGEIDLSNAAVVGSQLLSAIPNTAHGLILDLSAVGYFDSTGVALLMDLAQRLRLRHQRLRIVVPISGGLRDIIRLSQVELAIAVCGSLEEATASIGRPDARDAAGEA